MKNNKKGFTLVELLVVLAIAGLIVALIVFLIQNARRVQRDNARKSIASTLNGLVVDYLSNNGGFIKTGFKGGSDDKVLLAESSDAACATGGTTVLLFNDVSCVSEGGLKWTQTGGLANCEANSGKPAETDPGDNLIMCFTGTSSSTNHYKFGVSLEGAPGKWYYLAE